MKLSFNKQRNNRRYNYTPRYYKGKEETNPYAFENTFERYRDMPNKNDFGAHWREARSLSRNRNNKRVSPLLLMIIVLLLLGALYVLDFDLSIF